MRRVKYYLINKRIMPILIPARTKGVEDIIASRAAARRRQAKKPVKDNLDMGMG